MLLLGAEHWHVLEQAVMYFLQVHHAGASQIALAIRFGPNKRVLPQYDTFIFFPVTRLVVPSEFTTEEATPLIPRRFCAPATRIRSQWLP